MKRDFWEGKRVLVTGYEGFLGSWLTRFLLERRAQVAGLDIRVRRKETILTRDEVRKVSIFKGSVEDAKLIERILLTRRIEFIFHLAAWAIVGECLRKPALAISANVRGTWNMLEAARNNTMIKGLVIASSDKAYGSHTDLPYKEDYSL
ncbi:MAG: GDP-mannose 4,6-dehydratase, partial [Candidatus Omnitrophica bacterium]|nr:GDP-mannose 4,6-dehydratase [Candidatus Omnitrophota bacterium]